MGATVAHLEMRRGGQVKRSSKIFCVFALTAAGVLSVQLLSDTLAAWSEKRRVIEAVNFALTLEQKAEEKAPFESRADLEEFFRQGFGTGLAADMARFNWPHGADESYPLPVAINVLSLLRNEAVTFYETPEPSLNPDKSNQYAIQKVLKEGNSWIVCEVSFSTKKPTLQ
jgi:hypothetical protein